MSKDQEFEVHIKDAPKKALLGQSHIFDPRIIEEGEVQQVWTSESVELAVQGIKDGYKLKESPFNKNIKDAQLRKGNLSFKFSEEELMMMQICMEDKVFWGNEFGRLKDAEHGWQGINLRPYQEDLLLKYAKEKWNLLMFPRQSGKTTTTVLEIVHFCCFNWDKDCVVIAQSEMVVNEILQKIKNAFEGLPFFMQPGFISFNKKGFVLDNGCRLSIGVASESVVQGFALDFLFIDEFAYIPSSRVKKFWNNIYPALVNNPKSKCIIASTPNGRNFFYELWIAAEFGRNRFKTSRVYWYEVPRRSETPGLTYEQILEEFKRDTIANVGLEGWLMGFECSFDTQLNSIFHTKVQQKLRKCQQEHEQSWSMDNHPLGQKYGISFIHNTITQYDLKQDYFLIGIDLSEGLGQDHSIMKIRKMVWNKTEKRLEYKLIGVYSNNEIPVDEFATHNLNFFREFNRDKIRIVVENNNYGGEYFNQIDNLKKFDKRYSDFDNIVFAKFERASKDDFERGIRWDAQKKKTGVTAFKTLISNDIFDDTHSTSINEALNFGRNVNGTYAAQYGHDDLVMSDVTLSYYVKVNNLFSREFLMNCESCLRELCNDLPEEVMEARRREEEEKNNQWTNAYGFHVRDSKKENTKRASRRRGGNGNSCYLI